MARRLRSLAGAVLALAAVLAAGEAFLRAFPPADFVPYLAEDSGLAGPYRADDRLGARYRSWEAFADDHPGRPASVESPRCWAMFGSSFVHMRGMLADTARAELPGRPVFNLGRNEPLFVRVAQIEAMLDHGERPERVFFVVIPHDSSPLAKHSLSQVRVTPQGGIAYAPRDPGGLLGPVLRHSRLALMAWVRSGRQQAVPSFRPASLNDDVHPAVFADLRSLAERLGEAGRHHGVPITVVLIPNHEQITRGARFAFQDRFGPVCREAGLDVCDVRRPFLDAPDKPDLFIPDKHFSPRGNRLLLAALLDHVGVRPEDRP